MSMTVGELVATFDIDSSGADAGITRAEMQIAGLRRDVAGTLRDINGDVVRQSAAIGQHLGEGIRTNLDAALADLHPQIAVDADSRPAEAEAARLVERIRRLSATIDVDAPVEGVEREVAEIRAGLQTLIDTHPDITVQTNAANALVTLEATRAAVADLARQHASIHVDTNAPSAVAALTAVRAAADRTGSSDGPGRLASMMGSLASSLGGVLAQAGQMGGIFGAAASPVAGLVATLVDIVPAAAVATTALLSVAQAAAVIKIGTSGVGSALKAVFADTASGGGAAAGSTHRVADAEMALASAQRSALQAQTALTAARKQAGRDLQDMNNQLTDGALAQRQATLDVTDAKNKLLADQAAGSGATADQVAQDQLAYDQAVQHLKEQSIAQSRLTSDTAAANKAGVDGSQKVKSAQDQVLNSQQALIRSQEALKDAMKPSGGGGGVNALAAAMAKLAPSARAFVQEIINLKPALTALKLDVQQHLFAGFAGGLAATAAVVLPIFRRELVNSAGALNTMGLGVLSAAKGLGTSGVLGSAMHSASTGLHNLAGLPGLIVTAFGQLAAAAGPEFDKLTSFIGKGAASIGKALGNAFKDGGLQTAITDAVSLIKELIQVGANVGSIFMSVFRATSQSGGSFLDVLKTISATLAKAFASPAVQSALKALFSVFQDLADTAAPLLMQALGVIAPVLTALGPPAKVLIGALGVGLSAAIKGLGPLLLAVAKAVGALVVGLSPLLPVVGQIIGLLASALAPILAGVATIFQQMAPLVSALATALMSALGPILSSLPVIITPLVKVLTTLTGALLPIMTQLVVALAPILVELGIAFGQIMVALAPLVQLWADYISKALNKMVPILTPIIALLGRLAAVLAGQLAKTITTIVVPSIKMFADILSGHMTQATKDASGVMSALWHQFSQFPGVILSVFSDIGNTLVGAGKSLIGGFISGIESAYGSVKSTLGQLTSDLTSWKGPPAVDAKILGPNGQLVMKGFMGGIASQVPALRRQLGGITGDLGGMAMGPFSMAGRGSGRSSAQSSAVAQQPIIVKLSLGTHDLGEILIDPLRMAVSNRGGSVQATLGRG